MCFVRCPMLKKLCLLLLTVSFLSSATYASGGSTHHSSAASRSTYVRSYTKKDGTYVAPHERRSSGTAVRSPLGSATSSHNYRSRGIASGYDSHGRIKRSAAAKDAFKRQQRCPSTGRGSGSCPGYVIDHVKPLECGGADDPSNMQWQTIAEGKAKDKTERSCR
jgi:hypothetical protein